MWLPGALPLGLCDPQEYQCTPTLVTVLNLVTLSHTLGMYEYLKCCARRGNPKKLDPGFLSLKVTQEHQK